MRQILVIVLLSALDASASKLVNTNHAESAKAKKREERAEKRDRGQNNKSSRGQTTVVSGQRVKSYTYGILSRPIG